MKGNTLVNKSFATIALAILLISLLPVVPLAVTPVKAGTYLTVSSAKLGKENVLAVTVEDPGIDPDVGPTVIIDINGDQRKINMSRTVITSRWIAYIANDTAETTIGGFAEDGLSGYSDRVAWETDIPANPAAVFFSQGKVSNTTNQYNYTDVWPVVQLFSITVDEVTITYEEKSESVTIDIGETEVEIASVDRTEVPPAGKIYIDVSDPTENIDPTAEDEMSYSCEFTLNGESLGAQTFTGSETDVNTGTFTLTIDLLGENPRFALQTSGSGIAKWTTDYAHSGSHSVKLYAPPGGDYAKIIMPLEMLFSDLTDFSVYVEGGESAQALPPLEIELKEITTDITIQGNLNAEPVTIPQGTKRVNIASQPGQEEFPEKSISTDAELGWEKYGTHSDANIKVDTSAGAYWGIWYDVAGDGWDGFIGYVTWEEVTTKFATESIKDFRVELRYPQIYNATTENVEDVESTVYIDDITINDITYNLEPFENGDVFEVVVNDDDTGEPTDTLSTQEFTIRETDGVVSVSAAEIYYSDGNFTVTVTDADMNLDTEAEDTLDVNGTVGDKGFYMTLEETDEDTGVFEGTIYVNIGSDLQALGNSTDEIIVTVPPAEVSSASFKLTYHNDPYYAVYETSEATFDLATVMAEVSFDKDVYTVEQAEHAQIILNEPDANDDPDRIDTLTIEWNGAEGYAKVEHNGVWIGNFTLEKDNTALGLNGTDGKTLIETGKNTGVFKVTVNLVDPDGDDTAEVGAGDTLTLAYYDAFDDDTAEATASIGGVVGSISLDRDVYPIAPGEEVTVYVTLTDADANVNPNVAETAKVTVTFYNATEGKVTNPITVSLKENGTDTGIFTGKLTYEIAESSFTVTVGGSSQEVMEGFEARDMVNGKIFVNYTEPMAEDGWVSTEARLKARTASISVNATSVSMGDAILVTLTEPDMDLNSESADTVMVGYSIDDDFEKNVKFEETGDSTGVFTAEFVVGEDITVNPGETITFNYTDPATDASYYGTRLVERNLEVDVDVLSHTAVLTLDAEQYGPFSVVTISLYDPDLALVDDPSKVKLRMVRTSIDAYLKNKPADDVENGTFTWEIQLHLAGEDVSEEFVQVDYTDDLYVYYIDGADASGVERTISAHATVLSEVATVKLDKASYLIDEWMTITVTDFDSNTDPETLQDIEVTIYSDTWPVGQDVRLPETDVNTGVFQAKVQLIDELPEPNALEIWVSLGDTITVEYTDSVNPTEEDVKVSATAKVGAVVEYPVPASEPFLTDTTGAPVVAEAGKMLLVQANITNEDAVEHSFVFLAQVKDENGVVIHLAGSGGTIAAGASMTPFVSWTPPAAGTYTVEVYVWKSLPEPEPLSLVATYTFVVLE